MLNKFIWKDIMFCGESMIKKHFRFSYFIIVGLLGWIIQFIAFFSFSDTSITSSNLIATSSDRKFWAFMGNQIVSIVGSFFVAVMFLGYLIGKKPRKSPLFTVSVWGAMLSEIGMTIASAIYLIYASSVRVNMFSSKTSNALILANMLNVRYLFLLLSFGFIALFCFALFKMKPTSKAAKIGLGAMGGVHALSFLLLLILMGTSLFHPGYSMLTRLYEIRALPPYESIYVSPNGLTLGQLIRLSWIPGECSSLGGYSAYAFGAATAIGMQILYLLGLVASAGSGTVQLIESYDIDRDSERMEI